MTDQITPGDTIQGPFWQGTVHVVSIQSHADHDTVTVHPADGSPSRTYILTPDDWQHVRLVTQAERGSLTFTGDPARFRLGIQAHRLRLAHSIDPYAALNASRVDPLPHQFEAVYEHLLARPVVRALLAHDAGAGKTIMAGLVIKELVRRQGVRRILIVTPAGLTDQWRRELLTKFGEDFTIVSREYMNETDLDSLDVWRATGHAITSIDLAKQKVLRQALESVEWDLVIVDEAHKLAAYLRPNGSVHKTQAYELGEVLARHTTHFLLATATPHKGDPDNYRLLVNLLDPDQPLGFLDNANPAVLRRTKEEMRKPNGEPLYPERIVSTLPYNLSNAEGALMEQVHKFIQKQYKKATSANRPGAAFALLMMGRRLASTPYALRESLQRLKARADAAGAQVSDKSDWAEWEELSEQERWEREAQAEAEAAALVDVRRPEGCRQLDTFIAKAEDIIRQGQQEKMAELRQACDLWVRQRGEQLIIFTEFKDTLDYLLACLHEWGYTTTHIHGGIPMKERRKAEKAFWKGEAQILVATEAAGEGINLQCCHVMINFDLPWNPCRLEQRMGRIHRYGQAADKVYIFNMLARNSPEDQVKEVIIEKQKQMRRDLRSDKVFDVIGNVLWGDELRHLLERIALGDYEAVDQAKRLVANSDTAARQAIETEARIAATATPLDIADFQRKQATFRAHRLSPEESEKFFRQAVLFVGGNLSPLPAFALRTTGDGTGVRADSSRPMECPAERGRLGERPVFDLTLPPDFCPGRPRHLTVSFWPEACSDDETQEDAVLFIAPGHWLFEALLDRVIEQCTPDLNAGAVLFDLQPQDDSPYLVWFASSHLRDGLDRRVADMLAAVRHRADEERVTPKPSEVLDGFEHPSPLRRGAGGEVKEGDVEAAIRHVRPMLAGQSEVVDQCVGEIFLPELARRRVQQQALLERDRRALEQGLMALAEHLNDAALEAYSAGDVEQGNRLTTQSEAARDRLDKSLAQMAQAGQLLMIAPEVLGVALVLPAPLEVTVEEDDVAAVVAMRTDPQVELAAMQAVMEYETRQDRVPRDVHKGNSWDIESYDQQGKLLRCIEVKG
ncbi:MAG: DEAD/DEAH box helicase family protein, partial [Thermoflexales bacterium]|nr:DEAD/DEAH box helicase family protein [Thermoflexales bacterium]